MSDVGQGPLAGKNLAHGVCGCEGDGMGTNRLGAGLATVSHGFNPGRVNGIVRPGEVGRHVAAQPRLIAWRIRFTRSASRLR